MPEPAFKCVGYTAKADGLNINCGNCKNWDGTCLVRPLLDELYMESREGRAMDRMMRSNRGISGQM
jgi:hypothetical protein